MNNHQLTANDLADKLNIAAHFYDLDSIEFYCEFASAYRGSVHNKSEVFYKTRKLIEEKIK